MPISPQQVRANGAVNVMRQVSTLDDLFEKGSLMAWERDDKKMQFSVALPLDVQSYHVNAFREVIKRWEAAGWSIDWTPGMTTIVFVEQ